MNQEQLNQIKINLENQKINTLDKITQHESLVISQNANLVILQNDIIDHTNIIISQHALLIQIDEAIINNQLEIDNLN